MNKFDASAFVNKIHSIAIEFKTKLVYLSYCLQDPEEQEARVRTVMELSVELQKIKDVNIFSTSLGVAPIESIIQGDWDGAAHWVEHFTFAKEGPECAAQFGPLWERYRAVLHTAIVEARRRAQDPVPNTSRRGGN